MELIQIFVEFFRDPDVTGRQKIIMVLAILTFPLAVVGWLGLGLLALMYDLLSCDKWACLKDWERVTWYDPHSNP